MLSPFHLLLFVHWSRNEGKAPRNWKTACISGTDYLKRHETTAGWYDSTQNMQLLCPFWQVLTESYSLLFWKLSVSHFQFLIFFYSPPPPAHQCRDWLVPSTCDVFRWRRAQTMYSAPMRNVWDFCGLSKTSLTMIRHTYIKVIKSFLSAFAKD